MIRPSQRFFSRANLDPRLKRGLVGHWIGGGSGLTWFDRSGYGQHGVLTGGGLWVPGPDNACMGRGFDGVDDLSTATASPQMTQAGQVSFAFWLRPNVVSSRQDIGGQWSGGQQHFSFNLSTLSSGKAEFIVSTNGSNFPYVAGATNVVLGRWQHFAGTFDGSNLRVYLDGRLDGTTALAGPLFSTSTAPFYFGFAPAGVQYKGAAHDVRVYNRALSAAEVALLAQPSFQPVVPRRWFVGLTQITTAATSSVSTWVSPTASTRASVAASPSIASWVSPTAGTKASVAASPAVASWVVPNATIRIPRILPTVSVSRTVYSTIPVSRTVYDPIEVS